ncbi:gibberellin-regulated protein 13-like [Vicia villosa]|uniref:gibberellin-regulated protein 13-like n=1 Tax=Vicia villosa TaxID=3911 RepID=UPI00273AD183|nr:gibberellin-regulated protein 13-like [Vicia villosa]
MATKMCIVLLFLVQMLLLPLQNHAEIIVSTVEVPAPQPSKNSNTTQFPNQGITEGSLQPQECGPRCSDRCSNTQYKKPCLFFCQKCCAKCLCVPPGTYGNKQVCPCYNNWKTKRGGPKCP